VLFIAHGPARLSELATPGIMLRAQRDDLLFSLGKWAHRPGVGFDPRRIGPHEPKARRAVECAFVPSGVAVGENFADLVWLRHLYRRLAREVVKPNALQCQVNDVASGAGMPVPLSVVEPWKHSGASYP